MTLTLLLACFGGTFFLAESHIFSVPRGWLSQNEWFQELFECFFCLGFWVSLLFSFVFQDQTHDSLNWVSLLRDHLQAAFAGAAFTYVVNALVMFLESQHGGGHQDD